MSAIPRRAHLPLSPLRRRPAMGIHGRNAVDDSLGGSIVACLCCDSSCWIDPLRDACELLARLFLFTQRLLQQLRILTEIQSPCELPQGPIGSDLIVLDALRLSNQRGVANRHVTGILHQVLDFVKQRIDDLALQRF
jgi:hypothetical protein